MYPLLCIIIVRLLIDEHLLSEPCGQIMTQLEGLFPLNIVSLSLGDDWLIAWKSCPKDHGSRVVATICDGRSGPKFCD